MNWVDLTEERRAEQIRWMQQQKKDEAREKEATPKKKKRIRLGTPEAEELFQWERKYLAISEPELRKGREALVREEAQKAHREAYKEYKKRQRIAKEEAKMRGEGRQIAYQEYKERQRIAGEEAKIRGEEHATTYQQFKRKKRIGKEKTKMRKSRLHLEMGKRPKIPLLETGLPKKKRQGRKLTRNRPIGL